MARLSMPVPEKVWERHSDEIYILIAEQMTSIIPKSGMEKWI
jgi:hypothetical protein